MRLLMWILTIAFALAGLGLWVSGGFVGARTVARCFGLLALLSCPFLWASDGLVPEAIAMSGKQRLMLGLALLMAVPLILPWQLWL